MKKFTALLCFAALGMFAVGCEETTTTIDDVPEPGVTGDIEGGSTEGGSLTDESDLAPPITEEEPPELPAPDSFDPEMTPPLTPPTPADPVEPTPADPATEEPAAEEPAADPATEEPAAEEPAAEAEAEATPAPEGEAAPEEPAPAE